MTESKSVALPAWLYPYIKEASADILPLMPAHSVEKVLKCSNNYYMINIYSYSIDINKFFKSFYYSSKKFQKLIRLQMKSSLEFPKFANTGA